MAEVVFERVNKVYEDGFHAVHDLNLTVADGECLVLVGPSGCGKSTALRMIAGIEDITSGVMRIGDRVVNAVPSKDRDMAMVFQSYALYPHTTVAENIGYGLRIRKTPKKERSGWSVRRQPSWTCWSIWIAGQSSLRRTTSTRGDGTGDRATATGVPYGRAAEQPRRETTRPNALRDRSFAARIGRHYPLRHP